MWYLVLPVSDKVLTWSQINMEVVKRGGAPCEEMVPLTFKKTLDLLEPLRTRICIFCFHWEVVGIQGLHLSSKSFFFSWAYIVKIPGFVLQCLGQIWERQVCSSVPLHRQVNSSQMPPYLLKWRKELTLFWYLIRTVTVLFFVRQFLWWHILLFLKGIVKFASATERW